MWRRIMIFGLGVVLGGLVGLWPLSARAQEMPCRWIRLPGRVTLVQAVGRIGPLTRYYVAGVTLTEPVIGWGRYTLARPQVGQRVMVAGCAGDLNNAIVQWR